MEKTIKRLFTTLAAMLFVVALSGMASAEPSSVGTEPDPTMPDFTVPLTDGTTVTLSELLKEKDLVVLNLFATWCGPCEDEFPILEKVYEAHSDRMVILSVSPDPGDTMEMLTEYKASHGLTFPMGRAERSLDFINLQAVPTTFFISRDSKVVYAKVGAFSSESDFADKVEAALSPDGSGVPIEDGDASGIDISAMMWVVYVVGGLFLVLSALGRFLIFRKAGIPAWQGLVPILSTYREYDLVWNGWLGVLGLAASRAAAVLLGRGLSIVVFVLWAVAFGINLLESLKLAKAFGKGKGIGIVMALFPEISRAVLGLSKAQYVGRESAESQNA